MAAAPPLVPACPPNCPYPHPPGVTYVHGLTGLYFGHSWMRRWRNNYLNEDPFQREFVDQLQLRHFSLPGFDVQVEKVYVWGKGGLAVDGQHKIEHYLHIVRDYNAHFTVLELGSNDMACNYRRGEANSEQDFVQRRVRKLESILDQNFYGSSILGTAICEIAVRRNFGASGLTQAQFDNRRDYWNQELRHNFNTRETMVWEHQRSQIRGLKNPEVSTDDIHITTDQGFQ